MKLISKFHDYYDTVLAQGRDESVVYVRERSVEQARLSPDLVPWMAPSRRSGTVGNRFMFIRDTANHFSGQPYQQWHGQNAEQSATSWRVDEAFVLVAGKAYPVWVGFGQEDVLMGNRAGDARVGDVDPEHLVQAMTRAQQQNRYLAKEPEVVAIPKPMAEEDDRAYDYARARFLEQDFTAFHLSMQAPVLLVASPHTLLGNAHTRPRESQTDETLHSNIRVIKNPRLADIGFARTLDPFSCFQDISQFITGVVPGQQMPLVEISDKSKIAKKGFDEKYGFRTRPKSV